MTALIVVLIVVLALILVGLIVFLANLSDFMRYRRIRSM
jgi:hypothetical protein